MRGNANVEVHVQEMPHYNANANFNTNANLNSHHNASVNVNPNVNLHVEPIRIEPIHIEPIHIEPVKPIHIEPIHIEPVHVDIKGTCNKCSDCWATYRDMIPSLQCCLAWMVLIFNIFYPGIGTFIMACVDKPNCKVHCIIAVLQMVCGLIFIGWIWAIIWGVYAVCKCHGTAADVHVAVALPTVAVTVR